MNGTSWWIEVKFCLTYGKGDSCISKQICEVDKLCGCAENIGLQSRNEVGIMGLSSSFAWN